MCSSFPVPMRQKGVPELSIPRLPMHNLPLIVQSDLPPGFAFGGLEYWLRFAHTLRRQPHPFERLFGGGP